MRAKTCIALVAAALPGVAPAQLYADDPIITVLPTRSMSYNEGFAGRRQPVARPDDPKMPDGEKARVALFGFSRCVWKANKAEARKFLRVTPGKAFVDSARRLADGQCLLRGYLTLRPSNFQLAMFAAAYQTEFGRTSPIPLEASASDVLSEGKGVDQDITRYSAIMAFGDCVARADHTAAAALVNADPAHEREDAAFQAISPVLSGCVGAGSSVTLTKELAKGVIAAALYRQAIKGRTNA